MKKIYCIIVIFVLCSQFTFAELPDPNDPNGLTDYSNKVFTALTDPNDPNYVPADKPTPLLGEDNIVAPFSKPISLHHATELPQLKYRLLPVKSQLTDDDAAEIYLKAIEAMSDPNQYENGQVEKWIGDNQGQADFEQLKPMLDNLSPVLKLLEDAAYCRTCQWSQIKDIKPFVLTSQFKNLTQILAIKAGAEIAAGKYSEAVDTIRAGLAMGRHISDCDSMLQGVIGVATSSIMLKQLEVMIQSPDSPSMLRSLQDIPLPMINLDRIMDREWNRLKPKTSMHRRGLRGCYYESPEPVVSKAEILSYSDGQVAVLASRLDRFVVALECLEGIRFYATKYGKLPDILSDVDEIQLPHDPVTGLAFSYSCVGGKAVLKSPFTEKQARQTSTIYYEFTLEK